MMMSNAEKKVAGWDVMGTVETCTVTRGLSLAKRVEAASARWIEMGLISLDGMVRGSVGGGE